MAINIKAERAIVKFLTVFYDRPHIKNNAYLGCFLFSDSLFRFTFFDFRAVPIEPIYYRKSNYDNVCAWCKKPLNEDSVKKLQRVLTTHSTVQPNCGEQGCLRRNCRGSDGWTIKRPKKPKIPKANPKIPKAKPKSKGKKRKKPAGGEPPEKRRKE